MYFLAPGWDAALFTFFNSARNPLFDALMPIVSMSSLLWIIAVLLLGITAWRGGKRRALEMLVLFGLALVLSDVCAQIIKEFSGRVRPLNFLPGTWYFEDDIWHQLPQDFVTDKVRGSSFLSAHASNSMAFALAAVLFWIRFRPWIFILFLLPLVVGFSRIYLGKHFPSDVLAGWFLGAALTLTAHAVWLAARNHLRRGPTEPVST
ncbi:MAG: phosphatase PAP2 family protein [Desulfovibrio sp.]|nr:MAG: phosphatase PAP2 family protein [Desulfovibrio sp.]